MTRQWKRHDWCQQLQRCIRHLTMRADLHGNWNDRLQEDLKILGADPNLSTGRTFMDITSQRLSDFFSPLHLKHKKIKLQDGNEFVQGAEQNHRMNQKPTRKQHGAQSHPSPNRLKATSCHYAWNFYNQQQKVVESPN